MINSTITSWRNPFKDYGKDEADEKRYEMTLRKLPPHLTGTALDLGVDNPLTPILKQTYPKLEIINTPAKNDFDVDSLPFADKSFDTIFSFEVLEHLMNPLWNFLECRRVLKDKGTVYLTTPKGVFPSSIMWSERHFHEMDSKRLHTLSERAGLRIKRIERFNKSPFYYWKTGIIRPTLRLLFGGWFYLEMEKINR